MTGSWNSRQVVLKSTTFNFNTNFKLKKLLLSLFLVYALCLIIKYWYV